MDTISLIQDIGERMAINSQFESFFMELIKAGVDKCGGVDKVKENIKDLEESECLNHLDSSTLRKLINHVNSDDLN